MSGVQPAPRIRIFWPLILKRRCCCASSSEVTARIPKRMVCASEIWPSASNSSRRVIEILRAQSCRPPYSRMVQSQLGEFIRRERYDFRFMGGKLHWPGKLDIFDLPFEHALHGSRCRVVYFHVDRKTRFGKRRYIKLSYYLGESQPHRARGGDVHTSPDTEVLIRRRGIPIHEIDCQVVGKGWKHFDGKAIDLARQGRRRNVELETARPPPSSPPWRFGVR